MFTKPSRLLCRVSGMLLGFLLVGTELCEITAAQAPATVVSSSVAAFPHTGTYGSPWQTVVSTHGDFVFLDFSNGALYDFPANGGSAITIVATNGILGGFADSGIALDPRNNNLYLDDNFNNGLLEFPYDSATGMWDLGSVQVATSIGGSLGGSCGNYFQSAGLAINANGVMAVGTENGCGVEIFTVPIDASGNFGNATPVDTNMPARARTLAIDNAGNVYLTEDNGGLKGAYYFPAGTSTNADAGAIRVDPNLGNVIGVSVDTIGNIYVADQTAGVFLVPFQSGSPNPAAAVQLTPIQADANVIMDLARGTLDTPATSYNGFNDAVYVYLNRLELGAVAVGSASPAPGTVTYSFSASATPASFAINEAGSTADFAVVSGGSCAAGTAYTAQSTCTVNVNLVPLAAGDVSAQLLMLDKNNNILATTLLHGTGTGAAVQVTPGTETKIATGLATPGQVATDPSGNTYVAVAGKVTEYPAASPSTPVSIGKSLTAPTGVAVDGAGDVFIADSGQVYEVPIAATGLNAAGQTILKSGLGANLQLAVDGKGHIFIADPSNSRVVILGNLATSTVTSGLVETDLVGFSQLSAIAADKSGDLYLVNGSNLIEVSLLGSQTVLLNSLSGTATGLAVDASGAVYVTSASGTVRIPNQSGTLNASAETSIAANISGPISVALDPAGNLHLTDAGGDVVIVSADASYNFGTLSTTTSTASQSFTVLNDGNSPLTISGFAGTPDYSETTTTCSGTLAVGATCGLTVTFSAGPGDQGTLTGSVLVSGNEANTPVGVNAVGVGAALAASSTAVKLTNPTVDGAPAVITVSPATGTTPTPTGSVTLTVTGNSITPVVMSGILSSGTVTLNPTNLPAGAYTFAVKYQGDRAYSGSTASASVTVAAGAVTIVQPTLAQVQAVDTAYPYILSGGAGSEEPTNGSVTGLEYTYPVTVVATNGQPLIGVLNPGGKTINYGSVLYEVNGAVPTGCAPVAVGANGSASFNSSCLPINTTVTSIPDIMTSYTVTPVYTPAGSVAADNSDPNYVGVTGTSINFIALRNPMVVITSNPSSLSLSPGSTASATLTLTSLLGYGTAGSGTQYLNYTLPLELNCDGLPAYATCSFTYPNPDPSDPTSVDVTPTTPGTVMVTINTNISTGAVASLRHSKGSAGFAAVFGLGLLGLAFQKRRAVRARLLTTACLLLCAVLMAGISGCSTTQLGESTATVTPGGTYTVSITAKQVSSIVIPPTTTTGSPVTAYGQENQMSIPFTMSVTLK